MARVFTRQYDRGYPSSRGFVAAGVWVTPDNIGLREQKKWWPVCSWDFSDPRTWSSAGGRAGADTPVEDRDALTAAYLDKLRAGTKSCSRGWPWRWCGTARRRRTGRP